MIDAQTMLRNLSDMLDSLVPVGPENKASSTLAPRDGYVPPPNCTIGVVVKHSGTAPETDYEQGYRAAEERMKLERLERGKGTPERDDYLACTMLLQLVRDVRAAVEDGTLPWSAVDLSLPAAEGFLADRQRSRVEEQPRGW